LAALQGLLSLGLSLDEVEGRVAGTEGLGFLHRAVRSGNAGMVAEVVAWLQAAGRTLDWGCSSQEGVTPLHLAACLKVVGYFGGWLCVFRPSALVAACLGVDWDFVGWFVS
jgi:hypothetical protein